MKRVLAPISRQCRLRGQWVCRAYMSEKSKVIPLIKVTKEQIDAGRAGRRRRDKEDIEIAFVNENGDLVTKEEDHLGISAVWNTVEKRPELRRRVGDLELKSWVKGGAYLLGDLEKIEPLSEYWNAEKININGGVMVMPQLGRIPGETSSAMTLSEAVIFMLNYDINAPVAGTLEWKLQDEALEESRKNFKHRAVCVFYIPK